MADVLATWNYTSQGGGTYYKATCTNPAVCTKAIVPDTYNGLPVSSFYIDMDSSYPQVHIVFGKNISEIYSGRYRYNDRPIIIECNADGNIVFKYQSLYESKLQKLILNGKVTFERESLDGNYSYTLELKEGLTYLKAYYLSLYCSWYQTSLTIPNSLTEIICTDRNGNVTQNYSVFSPGSSPRVNTITIGTGLTSINDYLFDGFSGLKTVYLTDETTIIGTRAFYGCSSLTDIYYTGTQSQWNSIIVNSDNYKFTNATVHLVRTLTYNTNGGTLESGFDNPALLSDYPNPMPTVTYGNYSFGGWYTDNNTFANAITAGSAIPSNHTIYAKLYGSIIYNLDGGTNNALNSSQYYSSEVAAQQILYSPTKSGYNFDGWYSDSSFSTKVTNYSSFTGNSVTLYAKYVPQEKYMPSIKTNTGKQSINIDAYTVRGESPFVNINAQTLSTMGNLYSKTIEINDKNEHVFFDMSSFIPGAYVCLVDMSNVGSAYYCEIHDLLNNQNYFNSNGFVFTTTISSYISSCIKKDSYENVKINSISTMGDLRTYINTINTHGDHCFFDMSSYISGAYVCTIQMFTQSLVNYCFIFDILNGKLIGNYSGYSDATTVSSYCSGMNSDVVHAIKITDATTKLSDMIALTNQLNTISHHVFFDVSALNVGDYLITFTSSVSGSNTTCRAMGLVNGTLASTTVATSALANTTLVSMLSAAGNIALDSAKENVSNKVTSISSSSTDTQYPSAKCVYDETNSIKEDVDDLRDDVDHLLNTTTDWATIQHLVQTGRGSTFFPVGHQFTVNHATYGNIVFDVVGHDQIASNTGKQHTMTLLAHNGIANIQYDSREAFYYCATALAAGTYNITIDDAYDEWSTTKGGTYQFTTPAEVPAGGQLFLSGAPFTTSITSLTVIAYSAKGGTTEEWSSANRPSITSGTGGTNLGSCDVTLNSFTRLSYGSNNYGQSAIRQLLNSDANAGSVWTPQTNFDRPPSWNTSTAGFLKGIDQNFLAVVDTAKVKCATNVLYESPDSVWAKNTLYELHDRFFLASLTEILNDPDIDDGSVLMSYFVDATSDDRIKLVSNSPAYWWLRSTVSDATHSMWIISINGNYGTSFAVGRCAFVPACIIG